MIFSAGPQARQRPILFGIPPYRFQPVAVIFLRPNRV